MDFRSQLATFPRGVSVHELNEDDYTNNVKLLSTNGVERTRSKKQKQAFRNQVTFSSADPAAVAPPNYINNQLKGKSAISTSKINNKTDFQFNKQTLRDPHKGKISKPKPAKVTTFLPESQRFKIPFIIKQVAKDGNRLFCSILAAQGLNGSSHLELDALTVSLVNGTIMLHMQTLVINPILIISQKYHCRTEMNQCDDCARISLAGTLDS
jgi:hypothetical protein